MVGTYTTVYDWIAGDVLKGRCGAQVRRFAETNFNARGKRRHVIDATGPPPNPTQTPDTATDEDNSSSESDNEEDNDEGDNSVFSDSDSDDACNSTTVPAKRRLF